LSQKLGEPQAKTVSKLRPVLVPDWGIKATGPNSISARTDGGVQSGRSDFLAGIY